MKTVLIQHELIVKLLLKYVCAKVEHINNEMNNIKTIPTINTLLQKIQKAFCAKRSPQISLTAKKTLYFETV